MRLREFLELQMKDNKSLNEGSIVNRINKSGYKHYVGKDRNGYDELHGLSESEGRSGFEKNKGGLFMDTKTSMSDILRGYYEGGPLTYEIPEGDSYLADIITERSDVVEEYPIELIFNDLKPKLSKSPVDLIKEVDKVKDKRTDLKVLVDDFGDCLKQVFDLGTEDSILMLTLGCSDRAAFFEVAKGPKPTGDEVDALEVDRNKETMKFDHVDEFKKELYNIVSRSSYAKKCNTVYHVAAIIIDGSSGGHRTLDVPEFFDPE